MAELKPCPFCGEIPKYYQYRNEWCVECHSDKCWVFPETDLCSSKEEATEKWNTRTPTADVVEVERCKDCQWFSVHNKNGCYRPGLDHHAQMTPVYENDYCSYGTPKERGGEK